MARYFGPPVAIVEERAGRLAVGSVLDDVAALGSLNVRVKAAGDEIVVCERDAGEGMSTVEFVNAWVVDPLVRVGGAGVT